LFEHSNKELISDSLVVNAVNRHATAEEIISGWAEALRSAAGFIKEEIKGVGIAMPGPFDYYHGISLIKGVDKFESLYNVNVREALSSKLRMDPMSIRFVNDASAFTIAETLIGMARNYQKCVGITLGTGFGSCFSDGGQPILNRQDVPSGGFLFDKLHNGKIADEIFSTRGIINSYYRRTGRMCDSVLQVALNAETDLEARETFSEFGKELGLFLLPYLQTFGANIVVLGGNICGSYHLFINSLHRQLTNYKVYVSSYGEKAAMIGAARLLDDVYYKEIQTTLKAM
jgi:glucokinase